MSLTQVICSSVVGGVVLCPFSLLLFSLQPVALYYVSNDDRVCLIEFMSEVISIVSSAYWEILIAS